MSNFAFMDDPKFLRDPACALMYKRARMSESWYYANREVCALYARKTLEVFCPFVSELKGAVYQERSEFQIRRVGEYWFGRNEREFTRIVGFLNYRRVQRVNSTANSYIHAQESEIYGGNPARDDFYPEMLKNLYELLLWLYEELGLKTVWGPRDYSPSKIPRSGAPESAWDDTDMERAPERTLKQLKKAFPNCNTDGLCSVERDGDRYLIRDLHGNEVGELAAPEVLEDSQAEVERLKAQMDEVKREYEAIQEELTQLTQDKDERIRRLEETVREADRNRLELTASQSREIDVLRKEIRRLEATKRQIADTNREKLRVLGDEFNALEDKYQALLPVEEQRDALRRQVKVLMEERAVSADNFSKKQEAMLEKIADTQRRLKEAQARIRRMNCAEADSRAMITQLQRELDQKTSELRAAQEAVNGSLRQYQTETVQILQKYGDRPDGLAAAEANAIKGTARFQAALAAHDQTDQVGSYLQIANQGLAEMNRGLTLYGGNAEKLREFLWQVKVHYETQIADLEDQLEQKEKELEEERRRSDALFRSMTAPQAKPVRESSYRYGRKKNAGKLVRRCAATLALVLGLGFLGYRLVDGGFFSRLPGQADVEQEDPAEPSPEPPAGNDAAPAETTSAADGGNSEDEGLEHIGPENAGPENSGPENSGPENVAPDDTNPDDADPEDTSPPEGPEPEAPIQPSAGVEQEPTPAGPPAAEPKPVPEQTPAVEPPPEQTPAVEPPPEQTPAAEPPPEQTPAVEPPPEQTPAAERPPEQTPAAERPPEQTPAAEPPPENRDDGAGQASAAEALENLLAETEAAKPPESISDIPGINSRLVEELDNMDWRSTKVFDENTRRDHMYFIGATPLPSVYCAGPRSVGFVNAEMRSNSFLSNAYDNEVIKFGYTNGGRTITGAAAEISDLSDRLSRGSTLEEVIQVLGKDYKQPYELGRPTKFTDAQTETAVIFFFSRGSVIICFDEQGGVCDYAYIHP